MSKKRTAAFSAGILSALVAGGVAFAPVAGAEAEDSAYALGATGIADITKVPHVVGEGKDHLVATALPSEAKSVLEAGVFNAAASEGYANASTADAKLNLLGAPKISLGMVTAECENKQGRTSIADLKIGSHEVKLDQIAPNTEIVPEPLQGVARITLNKQEDNGDSLTVTALSIDVLNSTQTLDISSATCTKKAGDDGNTPDDPGPGDGDNGGDDGDNGDDGNNGGDPTTPPADGDNGDNGGDDGGDLPADEPTEDGKAPKPVPQPGHLDVTG